MAAPNPVTPYPEHSGTDGGRINKALGRVGGRDERTCRVVHRNQLRGGTDLLQPVEHRVLRSTQCGRG